MIASIKYDFKESLWYSWIRGKCSWGIWHGRQMSRPEARTPNGGVPGGTQPRIIRVSGRTIRGMDAAIIRRMPSYIRINTGLI